jgi:hypothetical protein
MPESDPRVQQTEYSQEIIPGLEPTPINLSPMLELIRENRPIAFGRVVMPYFFNLDEADYVDIGEREIEAANPRRFLQYLVPGRRSDHPTKYAVDGVALDSIEYERIIRNLPAFARSIGNKTHKARALQPSQDVRRAAEIRSVEHGATQKVSKMQSALKNIRYEHDILDKLSKEAKSPGFAHKKALDMLSWTAIAHGTIFRRMLNVVGREKDWTAEQAELAARSLDARLFFAGSNNDRVGYWRDAFQVARIYGQQREKLFDRRIEKTTQLLGKVALRTEK